MAQPFIALGLKGADFLVDKHFEKVPDAVLHPETYHPANLTSKQRRQRTREKRRRTSRLETKIRTQALLQTTTIRTHPPSKIVERALWISYQRTYKSIPNVEHHEACSAHHHNLKQTSPHNGKCTIGPQSIVASHRI
jgi:acyl-CoA thioesterase